MPILQRTTCALVILGFCAVISPLSAVAQDNCDVTHNNFDGMYCLTKVYLQADKELNTAYGKLTKQLNKSQKNKLKRGQLAWIRERNHSCSHYDESNGFFVNMDCATNMTSQRVNFLNARLRECHAGSCRDSQLGQY